MKTLIKKILREEVSDNRLLDAMVKYLDTLISDVKEANGSYYFIGYDDKNYAKIRYYTLAKEVYYRYGLSDEMAKIFGEEFMERIGIENIVKRYVEDTLQVEVSDTQYQKINPKTQFEIPYRYKR